jgi:hypothetical protein
MYVVLPPKNPRMGHSMNKKKGAGKKKRENNRGMS